MSGHMTSDLAIHAVYPTKRHVSLKLRRFVEHLSAGFGDAPGWDLKPGTRHSAAGRLGEH